MMTRIKLPEAPNYWTGPSATVYRVQCLTFGLAKQMLGISGDSCLAMRCDMSAPVSMDALTRFRAKPEYRTPASRLLRANVAALVRDMRRGGGV